MSKIKIEQQDEWFGWKKTVSGWNNAVTTALLAKESNFAELIKFYDYAYLDDQVMFNVRKRIEALRQSTYDTNVKELNSEWFFDLMKYFIEAQLYGYSVLELTNDTLTNINRRHINPRFKQIYKREYDRTGIKYDKFKGLIEVYNGSLGLLQSVVPLVIVKGIALRNYGTYLQRNGSGFKVIKTAGDKSKINDFRNALSKMANNTGLVMGLDDIIETYETNGRGGDLFKDFIQMCDTKISKIVSGAVLGEDSSNGSRAKEEVSKKTAEEITRADKKLFEVFVNKKIIPMLNSSGTFAFTDNIDNTLSLEWSKIITQQGYKINKEVLENISGLKIEKDVFDNE